MKPFDLESAKAGHPVCTRDGRKARIVCFDRKSHTYPIVALVEESSDELVRFCTTEGYCNVTIGIESKDDLFMVSESKEGWINIYSSGDNQNVCFGIYSTKEEALSHTSLDGYIDTIKIEWEE